MKNWRKKRVSRVLGPVVFPGEEFLAASAAFALNALVPFPVGWAQGSKPDSAIDIHHHFGPPEWCSFLAARQLLLNVWDR